MWIEKASQVHARRPAGSTQIQSQPKVALHMKSCKGYAQPVNHAMHTFQPIGQSRYPYLSTKPFDSASAAVYNLGPLPWCLQLNFFSSDVKNLQNTAFSFSWSLLSKWHHGYTTESDAAPLRRKRGPLSSPQKCQFHHQGPASSIILFRSGPSFQQQ